VNVEARGDGGLRRGSSIMAIAKRLQWYLDRAGVDYEILPHPRSAYSAQTARR
jgi:hypothetical protein